MKTFTANSLNDKNEEQSSGAICIISTSVRKGRKLRTFSHTTYNMFKGWMLREPESHPAVSFTMSLCCPAYDELSLQGSQCVVMSAVSCQLLTKYYQICSLRGIELTAIQAPSRKISKCPFQNFKQYNHEGMLDYYRLKQECYTYFQDLLRTLLLIVSSWTLKPRLSSGLEAMACVTVVNTQTQIEPL